MANWTVFIPGKGNITVEGTEEDLNKTLEQYAASRPAPQEKPKDETLGDLASRIPDSPSSLYNETDVNVPWEKRIAKGYNYLTNQDIKDIRNGWWTGEIQAALLNAPDELLGTLPSRTVGAARSTLFGEKAAEETKAWREIQEEEYGPTILGSAIVEGTVADLLSGGSATPAVASGVANVSRLAKLGQAAKKGATTTAKVVNAPIAGAKYAKGKLVGETVTKLAEGNAAKRLGGKVLSGATEGLVLGTEYELAQGAGTGIDLASGAITTKQAIDSWKQQANNAPYALATTTVIGGGIPLATTGVGGAWKGGKWTYNKVLNKIHLNESDVEAFNRIVGPENLKNATMTAQRVIDEGLLRAQEEGTVSQLESAATDTFWGELFKNIDPKNRGDLLKQVRRNPELSERIVKHLTGVQEGMRGETLGLTNKDFSVLAAEINKLLGDVYGAAPEGVVQRLGDDFVQDALGRSSRMADTRKDIFTRGAKEVQENVNREKAFNTTEAQVDLFTPRPENIAEEYKFKGKTKQALSNLSQNTKDLNAVAEGVVFDEIPSYKPGTTKGDAFARKIRKEYETRALNETLSEMYGPGVTLDALALEPESAHLIAKAQESPLYRKKIADVDAWATFEKNKKIREAALWVDDIATHGTDDVNDLMYLKEVGNNTLKKVNPDTGQITNWGKVNKNTNDVLREYSGEGGVMRTALNTEAMGDLFEQLYNLGKNYGKGAADITKLTGLFFNVMHDTPATASGVAARQVDKVANRAAGEAFFKLGFMEQMQNAALDGDVGQLEKLLKILSTKGGNGLAEHVTTEEIWNSVNKLMPVARANRNLKDLLQVAGSKPMGETPGSWGPYIRSFLGWLTGSRNTMMNALVTILDRQEWSGRGTKALQKFVESPTAETLNTLINSTSKDPIARKQLARSIETFFVEVMPSVEDASENAVAIGEQW